jgi:plastocyanin
MLKTITRTAAAAALTLLPLAACGGGSSTANDDVSNVDVKVHALDALRFDKTEYTVHSGDISIGYVDDGSLQHDLLIDGHGGFKLTVSGSGSSRVGKTNLAPGTYTIYCDIPTHREAGMQAKLIVTEPPPTTASGAPSASASSSPSSGN